MKPRGVDYNSWMATLGITTSQAGVYQKQNGYNEILEKRTPLWKIILGHLFSPISLMLMTASALSFIGESNFDGFFILILLLLNIGITLAQEHKADTAVAELNKGLTTTVRTMRDGTWNIISSRELVPGDVITLKAGDVIPADALLLETNHASADEAALTGESLPKEKNVGDPLYSGSFLASGLVVAQITTIGGHTSFGKTILKADTAPKQSALERDILRISRLLSFASIVAVCILTTVLVISHASWLTVIQLDLSLIIAGIPISLPTVMTLIIAYGVIGLAKKQVIVRRLSALQELANTNLLLTDKTGTLTKNKIGIHEVKSYGTFSSDVVRAYAALVAHEEPEEIINRAFVGHTLPVGISDTHYTPADSIRKHATLTFTERDTVYTIAFGAPHTIESMSFLADVDHATFLQDVSNFAARGFRTLAIARTEGSREEKMELMGVISLSDELRDDAPQTIQFLAENGIQAVMVTGDDRAIAREIGNTLHLPGDAVISHAELIAQGWDAVNKETFLHTRAFAEILPEDKYELVQKAKNFYTVASNGDGVNDLPAVKAAHVGFAVANAVPALKGAADIVLLTDGISVMRDAFIEGRKIFERLYSYSLYRISESFRLIVTIVILGLILGSYPLTPLQLILIALLNDIPIISLATDRVRIGNQPSKIVARDRFLQSIAYGMIGVANSIIFFFVARDFLHLSLPVVETLFFLKLTVSGHLLVYVAHTKERWWRFLPSKAVIIATTLTQIIATILALTGFLMPAPAPWKTVLLVWGWSFIFMQLSELVKRRAK